MSLRRFRVVGKKVVGDDRHWEYTVRASAKQDIEEDMPNSEICQAASDPTAKALEKVRYVRVRQDSEAGADGVRRQKDGLPAVAADGLWSSTPAGMAFPAVLPVPGYFWKDQNQTWRSGYPRPPRTSDHRYPLACGVPDHEIRLGDLVSVANVRAVPGRLSAISVH